MPSLRWEPIDGAPSTSAKVVLASRMMKRIIFQAYWLLGITAGLVLAVMGVTGAAISSKTRS
jgi:hypothetical protein